MCSLNETQIIYNSLIRIEETKVTFRDRSRFQILVEESEEEGVSGCPRSQGSARMGRDVFDKIAVVKLRIRHPATDFIRIAKRRPASLRDDDGYVVVAQALHG